MNEFDFIGRIRDLVGLRESGAGLVRGIGDDAAVIEQSSGLNSIVTADLLIEGIDFRRDSLPNLLGHKALAVSLSDIAAMGGRPRWALCSIGLPREVWETEYASEFYNGFLALADQYRVTLIGGDTSRSPDRIVVDSIVVGECASSHAVFRRGARAGDKLFVTGTLGGAAAGLRLTERGARLNKTSNDNDTQMIAELLLRQLQPQPRVGWGMVLGQERLATAMIDISDGLSSDVTHLCTESRVGAKIDCSNLPIDTKLAQLCGRRALDPLMLALHGGEDFELLFTVAPEDLDQLPKRVDGIGITCIGEITEERNGIRVVEGQRSWELKPQGWKHF
jgi:thiamine-monophosphate kinase